MRICKKCTRDVGTYLFCPHCGTNQSTSSLTLGQVYSDWSALYYRKIGKKTREGYENAWKTLRMLEHLEMLDITVEGIIRQNQECKSNNELANFWNVVSYLLQDGEIFNEADYRIDYMKKFKSNVIKNEMEFIRPRPILMMRKNRIFMLYKKFAKQVGDTALPPESLKFYLENSKEYLGVKNSVRFKNIQNGVEVTKRVDIGEGRTEFRKTSTPEQAMCFDYEMIMSSYNINLEIDTDTGDNDSEDAKEEPLQPPQNKFSF